MSGVVDLPVVNFYGEMKDTPSEMVNFLVKSKDYIKDIPFRKRAAHLCHNNASLRHFLQFLHTHCWDVNEVARTAPLRIRDGSTI